MNERKALFSFRPNVIARRVSDMRWRLWYRLLPWECCWWRHPVRALRTGRPYGDPFFWQFWLWRKEAVQARKAANYWMDKHDRLYEARQVPWVSFEEAQKTILALAKTAVNGELIARDWMSR